MAKDKCFPEVYSEPSQTSMMEPFVKMYEYEPIKTWESMNRNLNFNVMLVLHFLKIHPTSVSARKEKTISFCITREKLS